MRAARRRSCRATRRRRSHRSRASSGRARTRRSSPVVGSIGKTTTKDALAALCAAVTPTVAAACEPQQRARPAADRPAARARDAGARDRDGHARPRAGRRALRDRAADAGARHLDRAGAPRARRDGRERRPRERRGARRAAGRRCRGRPRRRAAPRAVPASRRSTSERSTRAGCAATRTAWVYEVGDRELRLELPFTQRHLAENVLAALTAYDALGLPLERAGEGAARIALSRWRGEVRELAGGGLVVNDAYNANPTSMRASLHDLVERADGQAARGDPGRDGRAGVGDRPLPRRDRSAPRRARDRAGRGRRRAVARLPRRTSTATSSRTPRLSTGSLRGFDRETRSSSRPRGRSGSKASPR